MTRCHNHRTTWRRIGDRLLGESLAAGKSLEEIAQELGRTENGVQSRMYRLKLRKPKPAKPAAPAPVKKRQRRQRVARTELFPDAYYEGKAADRREACPYDDRVQSAWWLAGFHDGEIEAADE